MDACVLLLLLLFLPPAAARAENAVVAGAVVVERPTLICLGFEWDIQGDDNRNAAVAVRYRQSGPPAGSTAGSTPAGSAAWKSGMPLLRMGGEKIFRAPYVVPNRFAGSIIDLEPDTEYEVQLTMTDPDGVKGTAVRTRDASRAPPRTAACCTSIRPAGAARRKSRASRD
jgi:hypothetical protein